MEYSNAFMSVLLENLQSDVLNRNVKIHILACFGDIALAIGPAFEPYLDATMNVLRQAGNLQPNPLDYDLIDYVNTLREGILDAYVGIVTGLKNTEKGTFVCFPLMCKFLTLSIISWPARTSCSFDVKSHPLDTR